MDAGLNIPFEGYQSVGTIPPVLAAQKPEHRRGTPTNFLLLACYFNGSAAERKEASSLVVNPTLRRRLSLPAGTATQNSGRLYPFELPRPSPEFHKSPPTLKQLAAAFISAFLSADDEGIFQEA
jgi:hypothetical protein